MKKILCVNYSQSGQLDEILDNFLSPLEGCEIDRIKVEPNKDFPFPWKTNSFYDAMPETVLEEPIELEPFSFKEEHYDLIIFGYQPWFLSPSMPATALLKNREFKKRLNNTPVITVIGARNMWLNSQKSVVKHVQDAGGKIVGNIPLYTLPIVGNSALWSLSPVETSIVYTLPKVGNSDLLTLPIRNSPF